MSWRFASGGLELRPGCERQSFPDDFWVTAPMQGVRVVQTVSPLAMAVCHLKASEVLGELLLDGASFGNVGVQKLVVLDRRNPIGVRAHPEAFTVRHATTA